MVYNIKNFPKKMGKAVYYTRKMDAELREWAGQRRRKPLILRGARQTGKSETVRALGAEFDLFIELNLEKMRDRSLVSECESADELLVAVKARENVGEFPVKTLLFLDEIQEVPEAIGWLRFFYEDYRELTVIAAGSLMDVRLKDAGFSFPVGRVTFRTLRPFSLEEFFHSSGRSVLIQTLREHVTTLEPLPKAIHDQALLGLREYLTIGGMPECVSSWVDTRNTVDCGEILGDLIQSMSEDIHKYRGTQKANYLEAAFENLVHHFGTRFKYENFSSGYKSGQMKTAISKLEGALVVQRVWPTSSLKLPLETRPKSSPKLLPLDLGMANYLKGHGLGQALVESTHAPMEGKIAEIFVGQQLLTAHKRERPLHFWVSESSKGNAEVDYLIPGAQTPIPLEVKSGASGRLRSLHQFLSKSNTGVGFRLFESNLSTEQHTYTLGGKKRQYTLHNIPLYLAEYLPSIMRILGL